ncbi:zinc-binding dehydrogenase, partial [Paraburkholderia diazotrophica]|uniref:zinc-binding dehydrogenase n=1 Tax=Paraburkholderia diazotrophica TaxID=667676 RepID=UPI00115F84E3
VQYAIAMGLHVVAVDIADDKLELARKLGAKLAINARNVDPAAEIQKEIGGVHGVLVTAVSRSAFAQALGMVRRGGTVALNGLPPGDFPLPIFSTVLNGITVRGSIVGTRRDLQESLDFAAQGSVRAHIHRDRIENINAVFGALREGTVDGRIVVSMD